jgi:hypothetical protein
MNGPNRSAATVYADVTTGGACVPDLESVIVCPAQDAAVIEFDHVESVGG